MKEPPELDITTFLNLMVVLIPFLLISAVFSRVTIMELSVPTGAGGGASAKPNFTIEVIVRKAGLELANGANVVAAIPKKDDQYDLEKLSKMLIRLKGDYPEKEDATVLMEPEIEYDYLIQVMDTVRGAEVREAQSGEVEKRSSFPAFPLETRHEEYPTHETNGAEQEKGDGTEADLADGCLHHPGLFSALQFLRQRCAGGAEGDQTARFRCRGQAEGDGGDHGGPRRCWSRARP